MLEIVDRRGAGALLALLFLGVGCASHAPGSSGSEPWEHRGLFAESADFGAGSTQPPTLGARSTLPRPEEPGSHTAGPSEVNADKSGTNPVNFKNELRLYHEHLWLDTPGDGDQDLSTVDYRVPMFEGKYAFRIKARRSALRADLNDDGSDDVTESGVGDTDLRVITVPYLDMPNRRALAVGVEAFLNTASHDALGSGTTALGPQVFGVFFKPFGGLFDLIAPAYQHKFSVERESGRSHIHQGFIDVFALKMSADQQSWLMINPTGILDYKNHTEFMLVDVECGTMLDRWLGTSGHSAYLRPSVQIGGHRPADYSMELGYKIIW